MAVVLPKKKVSSQDEFIKMLNKIKEKNLKDLAQKYQRMATSVQPSEKAEFDALCDTYKSVIEIIKPYVDPTMEIKPVNVTQCLDTFKEYLQEHSDKLISHDRLITNITIIRKQQKSAPINFFCREQQISEKVNQEKQSVIETLYGQSMSDPYTLNAQYHRYKTGPTTTERRNIVIKSATQKTYVYDMCFVVDHRGRLGNQLFDLCNLYCVAYIHQLLHPEHRICFNKSGYLSDIAEGTFPDIFKINTAYPYYKTILKNFGTDIPFISLPYHFAEKNTAATISSNTNIVYAVGNTTYICIRQHASVLNIDYLTTTIDLINLEKFKDIALPLDDAYLMEICELREHFQQLIKSGIPREPQDVAENDVAIHFRGGDFAGYSQNFNTSMFNVPCFDSIYQSYMNFGGGKRITLFGAPSDEQILLCLSRYLTGLGLGVSIYRPQSRELSNMGEMADIAYMSSFKNIISSPSTFSFFASYLSDGVVQQYQSRWYNFGIIPPQGFTFISVDNYVCFQAFGGQSFDTKHILPYKEMIYLVCSLCYTAEEKANNALVEITPRMNMIDQHDQFIVTKMEMIARYQQIYRDTYEVLDGFMSYWKTHDQTVDTETLAKVSLCYFIDLLTPLIDKRMNEKYGPIHQLYHEYRLSNQTGNKPNKTPYDDILPLLKSQMHSYLQALAKAKAQAQEKEKAQALAKAKAQAQAQAQEIVIHKTDAM